MPNARNYVAPHSHSARDVPVGLGPSQVAPGDVVGALVGIGGAGQQATSGPGDVVLDADTTRILLDSTLGGYHVYMPPIGVNGGVFFVQHIAGVLDVELDPGEAGDGVGSPLSTLVVHPGESFFLVRDPSTQTYYRA